ncbi:MAG: shikimate dehydrogenase [Pyrinomonadaceae bacterium]
MNNGKLCISICAKSSEELFEMIVRAEELADVIEVRFDCLENEDRIAIAERLSATGKNFLLTFRSAEQGGPHAISTEERKAFWSNVPNAKWADAEPDIVEDVETRGFERLICSYHAASNTSANIRQIYALLAETKADVLKIAVPSEAAVDAIPVWKLFETSKNGGKGLVPIAMGEAGKWTRILGNAYGAFMTFASLGSGAETAPGQISADDMLKVFRVSELSHNTEIFGILAGDTTYSLSPWMHNAAFKAAGMDRVFIPLQTDDIEEFLIRMVKPETREIDLNFRGFSVTNPHKRRIMKYLDKVDDTASKIGAVNTVKVDGGKLIGYNTDAPGFIAPLIKVLGGVKGKRVAIAGAGGAARACAFALKQEGANVSIFARSYKKASDLADSLGVKAGAMNNTFRPGTIDILVNATPIGTKGENERSAIANSAQLNGLKLVYDLVYNPLETELIREARRAGVPAIGGLDMLLSQGARQFEIWTGEKPSVNEMKSAILKKLR